MQILPSETSQEKTQWAKSIGFEIRTSDILHELREKTGALPEPGALLSISTGKAMYPIIACDPGTNYFVYLFPDTNEGFFWDRYERDAVTAPNPDWLNSQRAANKIRTWGNSGYINPRTGKEW